MLKYSLQDSTKAEPDVLGDVVKCKKCLTGKYLCSFHAESIKEIVMKEAKSQIEKLSSETQFDDVSFVCE
jgi:hypothetical protein